MWQVMDIIQDSIRHSKLTLLSAIPPAGYPPAAHGHGPSASHHSGHGDMGSMLAGGAAAAAAAYGGSHLAHGGHKSHGGHKPFGGHGGKFKHGKHGKFKVGKFKKWK